MGLFFYSTSTDRELASAARMVVRGDYGSALAAYDRILSRTPGQPEALVAKEDIRHRQNSRRLEDAARFLEQRRYSEALDAFMLVLVDDPQDRRALEGKEEAKRRMTNSQITDTKRP